MNQTMTVKPAAGLIVRDPDTGEKLKPDGETKPRNSYWLRRLADRDVEIVEPAAPTTRSKQSKE